MEYTTCDLLLKLKATPGARRTVFEWSSQVNTCILLALKTVPVEQYGIIKYHVRRAQEGFKAAQLVHARRREGLADLRITLEDPGEGSSPYTWLDWLRRVQFDMLQSPMVDISKDTADQFADSIQHLTLVYNELESAQSNAEGLCTHLTGFIM